MQRRSATVRVLSFLGALALFVGACGDDDDTSSSTTSSTITSTNEATTSSSEPAGDEVVKIYFLRDELVGPVARTVDASDLPTAAMEALLDGPTATEEQLGFVSNIPDGTELLGLTVDGGTATVDLSGDFESGGGSLSMMARVTEVVYTLTQFDDVDDVVFELDGEAIEFLGGEGLILDEPQTRADWDELAPAILVESPLPFEEVTSPLQITGTSNTFEATFQVIVTDGDGLIVYEDFATSTGGNGVRGPFDVTVSFDVPTAGVGALIVFELSAEDGSQINLVEVPLTIS